MPALQIQRYGQILERMLSKVVVRTDLSDVAGSSSFKHLLAAHARELDEVYFQLTRMTDLFSIDRAEDEDLDERAKDIQPAVLVRLKARKAVGNVQFGRTNTTGAKVIPNGTIIKTPDGLKARTTRQTQILDGQDTSELVPATMEEAGLTGNVASGALVKFGTKIAGIDTVTNPAPFTQGRDLESDDSFRARIKAYISSLARCHESALEFAALGVTDPDTGKAVVFSHAFVDPLYPGYVTLYIDDGQGTAEETFTVEDENVCEGLTGSPPDAAVGGEEFLYLDNKPIKTLTSLESSTRGTLTQGTDFFINPASSRIYFTPALVAGEEITADYETYTGLIKEVQKVIDGDKNDRENFPGWRGGGAIVVVKVPTVVTIAVVATLVLEDGADRDTAVAAAEAVVLDHINTRGISGDIVRNKLIDRIMGVTGVIDVVLPTPSSNVPVLDSEIPRTSLGNIDID